MVPDFVPCEPLGYGLLPKGIHKCSEAECKQMFVVDFPNSKSRQSVFLGFQSIRRWVAPLNLTGWHWVDGSFVTQKLNPPDADIVTFVSEQELDALSADDQTTILELIDGRTGTNPKFKCDTFLEPIRLPDDPLYAVYVDNKAEWAEFFGKTNKKKTGVDLPKGIIEMPIMHDVSNAEQSGPDVTEFTSGSLVVANPQEAEIEWSADDLQQRLIARSRVRQRLEASGDNRFSTQLQLRSLKKEEAWLQDQLSAAQLLESEYDGEFVFDGPDTNDHRVSASYIGKILTYVQDLSTYLTVGRAPSTIKVSFAPGSFKVPFVMDNEEIFDQIELDFGFENVPGTYILARVLGDDASKENIVNAIEQGKAKSAYAKLMKIIGQNSSTVTLRTRENPLGVVLTPNQARERADWLDEVEETFQEFSVTGELRGASLETSRFEIRFTDDTFYRGKATSKAAEQIRGLRLGSTVKAIIEIKTTTHVDLEVPRVRYTLQSIEDVNVPVMEL